MKHIDARRSCLLVAVLSAIACAPPQPKGPARTVASHPRALDRYARLLRGELADTNTRSVHQEMACEQQRLFDALGGEEMVIRTNSVEDSIFPTRADRLKRDAIRNRLAGTSFQLDGPVCDSLRRIADREDPIALVSDAHSKR